MVEVSLYKLVQVKDSQQAWPEEFRSLVARCEENLDDRLPFGVAADWLDERGEAELADAFRWLFKRPEVKVFPCENRWGSKFHRLESTPVPFDDVEGDGGQGFIGVIVALASKIIQLREALS